jgi:subtilase family serine protease
MQVLTLLSAILVFHGSTAFAASRPGTIEHEEHAGRIFLHRAVCARDNRPGHMHCHAHMRVAADGSPMVSRAATSAIVPAGYGPSDLRSAYQMTATGSSTTIIAVVDAYGYPKAESDLATYRAQFGLPACTSASGCFVRINQRGGTALPTTDTGWAQEQALDIQIASAMCPNCRILLIEADDDSVDNLAAGVALAATRGAAAISNSYGGTEPSTRAFAKIYRQPGIAITASAGDNGYGAEFPASAPYTIAVGGTKLVQATSTARGWKETVWSSTGSGCSALYPKPAWQTDTLCTKRMMNDVAVVAAPSTGVAVFGPIGTGTTSGWMVFGGTSVGAPLIAAIYAAAGARPTGARSLWLRSGDLFDITSGNDGICGGTYFCSAQVGYDGPSGNGAPKGKAAF